MIQFGARIQLFMNKEKPGKYLQRSFTLKTFSLIRLLTKANAVTLLLDLSYYFVYVEGFLKLIKQLKAKKY